MHHSVVTDQHILHAITECCHGCMPNAYKHAYTCVCMHVRTWRSRVNQWSNKKLYQGQRPFSELQSSSQGIQLVDCKASQMPSSWL